jgi:hypothetical protein
VGGRGREEDSDSGNERMNYIPRRRRYQISLKIGNKIVGNGILFIKLIILRVELAFDSTMKASTSTSTPVAHNALPPPSTSSAGRSSRIAPHSHIKGLGLNAEGLAGVDGAGFVGQTTAREVRSLFFFLLILFCGVVIELIDDENPHRPAASS